MDSILTAISMIDHLPIMVAAVVVAVVVMFAAFVEGLNMLVRRRAKGRA